MRHHRYNSNFNFVVEPEDFNKYSDKELLQYCLGATMYMPGIKDFTSKIINKEMPGLTSMVFCFEDACSEELVPAAEQNVLHVLDALSTALDNGELTSSEAQ